MSRVTYSFLDEGFTPIATLKGVICFSGMYNGKKGKYVSFDFSVNPTDVNRKFYREMVKLWGKFLEKPSKEAKSKTDTHIIMDMEKYSYKNAISMALLIIVF